MLWSTSGAAESSTQEQTQADFDRQSQDLKELSNRQKTLHGYLKALRRDYGDNGARKLIENQNSLMYKYNKGLAELRRQVSSGEVSVLRLVEMSTSEMATPVQRAARVSAQD